MVAAELEYANAYLNLGYMYEYGEGVEANIHTAMDYYLKAANAGNEKGMTNYGNRMLNGAEGLEKNEEEGIKWLTKAADLGYDKACSYLGDYYYGLEDYEKAFANYHVMAENGYDNVVLFARLGEMYYYGKGTTKNESEGIKWLEKAAQKDNKYALSTLGDYYYKQETYDKAFTYYKRVADLGHENKLLYHRLGAIYREGLGGVTKDEISAIAWLVKAYEAGETLTKEEYKFVGNSYYYGDNVEKNKAKALPYLLEASKAGDVHSMASLASIYHYTDGQKDYEQALYWYGAALDAGGLSDNNIDFCKGGIKKLVDDGYVTKEAAAKWLD